MKREPDGGDTPDAPREQSPHEQHRLRIRDKVLFFSGGVLAAFAAGVAYSYFIVPSAITQADIDAAVRYSIETIPRPPSVAAEAFEVIRPSVARVRRLGPDPEDGTELGVGTAVVIDDDGILLTNLHVVAGADRVRVLFADGYESDASVISVDADNDLAVLRVQSLPDDLMPAILRSTTGLRMGDEVFAVGHPFGIGPSRTARPAG